MGDAALQIPGGRSLKIREAGPPGPSPGSATDQSINTRKSDTKLFEMAKEKLPLPSLLELGKFRFRWDKFRVSEIPFPAFSAGHFQ